jgi:hypothetical protein
MAQGFTERFIFMLARVLRRIVGQGVAKRRAWRPQEPRLAVIRAAARRWSLGASDHAGAPRR